MRSSRLAAIGCVAAAALSIVAYQAVRTHGDGDVSFAVTFATIVAAAGLGWAVEDDAAVILASSPTTLFVRRCHRVAVAAAVLVAGWAGVELLAVLAGSSAMSVHNAALAAVTAGTALAVAAAAERHGTVTAGLAGFGCSIIGILFSTALASRFDRFPSLLDHDDDAVWLILAIAAWLAAAWFSRDPAGR